ncbi:hypothetical protein GALL_139850 [mine drainage metagenome]|uniref:NnrS protein n=1 Tax=mine drainage metagenome TaxID=410659 RepID=A0A1J5SI35_9ZZZZ
MLPLFAVNAVIMMAAALALWLSGAYPPQLAAHVAFALGVLPLILAAIAYFVPVLTRGDGAPRPLQGTALAAWAGGALIAAGFAGILPQPEAAAAAAAAAGTATLTLIAWIARRAGRSLGQPHPGLAWYLAALGFLAAALAAVPLMFWWPEQRQALRLFHLHANLLGFVGLTSIGTLQVLLPTAAGRPDPRAAARLRADLKFAVAGAALTAVGAAWSLPLAIVGAVLFLIPLVRMGWHWLAAFPERIGSRHGAAPALAAAGAGVIILVLAGIGHAVGVLSGRDAVAGFVAAFLLPLVTGAATQLLPVWLRPGLKLPWHDKVREALGRHALLRSLFMVAGGIIAALGHPSGLWLAAAGVALFAVALITALRTKKNPG